ncbi:MAG: Trk system potassium transporter TrkA [Gammaproteobacteria bacterium]
MRITIQGDNRIAVDLVNNLAGERAELILVGQDAALQQNLLEKHQAISCILGTCSDPAIFSDLTLKDSDTFITVTDNDELNFISCQIAHKHGSKRTLCRLRNNRLAEWVKGCSSDFGITEVFRPEQIVADQMTRLIQHPGAFQITDLHQGSIRIMGLKARRDGPLVGRPLSEIGRFMPNLQTHVAVIYTAQGSIPATGSSIVNEGDEVFMVARPDQEEEVIRAVHGREPRNKRILIAGGGYIGLSLAKKFQDSYQVKLIEQDAQRCEYLASELDHTLILHGTANDRDLLNSEYISEVDVFCAVTNNDQSNYLSALLAKKLGAHHVISLINEAAYVDLVEGRDIDVVLIPSQIALSELLGLVRSQVDEARRLRRDAAEVLSISAGRRMNGWALGEIDFPEGAYTVAIMRNNKMLIAEKNMRIMTGDSLIVFLLDNKCLDKVVHLLH